MQEQPNPTAPVPPRARRRAVDPALALLVAISLAINVCGITWGLPNVVDWAIDSIAPLGPLAYVHQMLHGGHWWTKYPSLHFTVLTIVDAPYLALLAARGTLHTIVPRFPYGLTEPAESLGTLVLIARLVSATMSAGATAAAFYLGRALHGRRAGFIGGLLFAASPLTVYYSGTGNLDIPYLFWSSLAFVALVRVARGAASGAYVALGVFSALAVATKDQAYGLFILLPIPLVIGRVREHGWAGLRDRRLLAGLVAAVATYAVAANVLVDWAGWTAHLRYITHEGSAPYQMFPQSAAGYVDLATRTWRLTVDSATWPMVLLATVGGIWAVVHRVRGAGMLMLAPVSYFASFIVPILYVFPRFVLPAVFVLAVFAGVGSACLWETRSAWARVTVAAAVGYVVLVGGSMNLGLLLDSRYAAESWMDRSLPPDAIVGTNGDPTYLPRLPFGVRSITVDIGPDGLVLHGAPPDFLVFSDAYYRRHLRHADTRPIVRELFAGRLEYERVATFHRRWLPATDLIPTLNPRIVILRRRHEGTCNDKMAAVRIRAATYSPCNSART
ncbi:MAG: glycosyltransferase family 39 protein [Deltaproteobacteria bacterium]|nr:glycosyltransferase family 39 protein [Deltaproteobacteria bacterium]